MGCLQSIFKKYLESPCQADYCENQIRHGTYCGKHRCRWGTCQGFAYNTGVDHRFCGRHECNFRYCRNRIYNEESGICIEHKCRQRRCSEAISSNQSIYCRYHDDHQDESTSSVSLDDDELSFSSDSATFRSIDLDDNDD